MNRENETFEVQVLVAIGASAGGLDALERFFTEMPVETGASFVVIQHLSPDHRSMMASLLSRHTSMEVVTVTDDMPLQPNTVFQIPPGVMMRVENAHLRLTAKDTGQLNLPIDEFFQSAASEFGRNAYGVILSGTGSDGTRGAAAINEAGGCLAAQDPIQARFDGMPRSVIATGFVDTVIEVEKIGPWIAQQISLGPVRLAPPPLPPTETYENSLDHIVQVVSQTSGINFQDYKPGTVQRRIERRMSVHQITESAVYQRLLENDRAEQKLLRRELLIPVTSFFRDPAAFQSLAEHVIAPLVAEAEPGAPIRVWSTACSTGEEAYSLAILFLEAFDKAGRWPTLKIFATDAEAGNIDNAAKGTFPESIMAEVSADRLERFFMRRGDKFVVRPELRQTVIFAQHNLLQDPPFGRMDLVVCRNLLIYFRSEVQERVLRRLHYAIHGRGYIFLGSSETLESIQKDFRPVNGRYRIWQSVRPAPVPFSPDHGPRRSRLPQGGRLFQNTSIDQPATDVELGYQALMKTYAPPPTILVDARSNIVHSFGDVGRFLAVREGVASLALGRLLSADLVAVATAVLHRASRTGAKVHSAVVKPGGWGDESSQPIRLVAVPVRTTDDEPMMLLSFENVQASEDTGGEPLDVGLATNERMEMLENELAATRESLQATIEELETSNEELQAINEEMMASNEELQSSNEELQSVNEELNTVNAEYQERIEDLNRMNSDLEGLTQIAGTSAIFVDSELNLTRFGPDAVGQFRVRETDIGRPIGDLVNDLNYPELIDDLQRVIEKFEEYETEVRDQDGRTYLVRMLPYSTLSTRATAAVLTIVDISESVNMLHRQQAVIDALAEHIALIDADGEILQVNKAWNLFAEKNSPPGFEVPGPGKNYLEACSLGPNQSDAEDAEAACRGISAVLSGESDGFTMEYPCDSDMEQRRFVMHVRPLGGEFAGAVVSHVDISAMVLSNRQHDDHS